MHDYHAEILALRGLSRFLLGEARSLASYSSNHETLSYSFLERNLATSPPLSCHVPPFRLSPAITVHLFATSAPCGSASLDLLIASKYGDNEPWGLPTTQPISLTSSESLPPTVQHGHANFHPTLLSSVRTKPSRPDAPPTLSKSCSDKIALSQFTGVLRFPADLFIQPVFIDSIVVPYSVYHEDGWKRAFSADGRLEGCLPRTPGKFFTVNLLEDEHVSFEFSRTGESAKNAGRDSKSRKVSNVSTLYVGSSSFIRERHSIGDKVITRDHAKYSQQGEMVIEALINGVKQGFRQDVLHPGKESAVCRRRMWELGKEVANLLQTVDLGRINLMDQETAQKIGETLGKKTYDEAKRSDSRNERRRIKKQIKDTLGGWPPNQGDEEWSLSSRV